MGGVRRAGYLYDDPARPGSGSDLPPILTWDGSSRVVAQDPAPKSQFLRALEDGEEDDASFVDAKAFGSDSDSDSDPRDAALVPDADEEEDASRATDDSSRFRSQEGSEEASEEASEEVSQEVSEASFAEEEEEALLSSETPPVVSEDDASSAMSAAEKNTPAAEKNDDSPPPPPPPPRPPPVPMDGPDMTDPANRAALDAYQSREKYVAWSKKAAKLEGRVVAPTRAVAR